MPPDLANSPLLEPLAGNPRSIAAAAQKLKIVANGAADPNPTSKCRHDAYRKVRLVMPDGSERSEWLENRLLVQTWDKAQHTAYPEVYRLPYGVL